MAFEEEFGIEIPDETPKIAVKEAINHRIAAKVTADRRFEQAGRGDGRRPGVALGIGKANWRRSAPVRRLVITR
jgi:hypothetical protein